MVFIVMLLVMFFVMFGDTLSVIEARISEKWDPGRGTWDAEHAGYNSLV